MQSGLLFGLLAALCWGTADFLARGATRAGGTFVTLLTMQVVGVVWMLALGLPLGLLHLWGAPLPLVLAAAAINLFIMAGAGLLYRALAIGTMALVSPIAAAFAGVTALLSLVSGERPSLPMLSGIALIFAGVVVLSAAPGKPAPCDPKSHESAQDAPKRGRAPGLFEALASMLLFGVAYWALGFVVTPLGGATVALIGKLADLLVLGSLAVLFALVALRRGAAGASGGARLFAVRRPPSIFWAFAIPTAILDVSANTAYNLGVTYALTSLVVVLSSLFSAITVLLAWLFLHERLTHWQWFGVVAILAGIVLVNR